MDIQILHKFTNSILVNFLSAFGINIEDARKYEGFENIIYKCEREGKIQYLRISHSIRRTICLVEAEIEFVNYLKNNGVDIGIPVLSRNERFVEKVEDSEKGYFVGTLFQEAKGRKVIEGDWDIKFIENYGRYVGKIHRISKEYKPQPQSKRNGWKSNIEDVIPFIPSTEDKVLKAYGELLEEIDKIDKSKNNFGLIHGDAHYGNLFIDEQINITMIDFDECIYSWFVNEIAIILFYAYDLYKETTSEINEFYKWFTNGYRMENEIDCEILKEIPKFIKLREFEIYAVINRSFDVNNITNNWCKEFMENRKEKLETNMPYFRLEIGL